MVKDMNIYDIGKGFLQILFLVIPTRFNTTQI